MNVLLPDRQLRELHLFAGCGGGILGSILLGHTCVCAVEIVEYRRKVLLQRQRDGILPRFPIWDDVRTFDGKPWRGRVDCVCGGFPCQDISVAGKGAGIEGQESGLWREMARIIGEVRPQYIYVENSPALTFRGMGEVLGEISTLGYDAKWGVVGASDAAFLAGNPAVYHDRFRMWIRGEIADAPWIQQGRQEQWSERERTGESRQPIIESEYMHGVQCHRYDQREESPLRFEERGSRSGEHEDEESADPVGERQPGPGEPEQSVHSASCGDGEANHVGDASWWELEPDVGRVASGIPFVVDRIAALGDAQVPIVAAIAFKVLGGAE